MKQKNTPLIFSLLIIVIYPLISYFIFIPFLGFYKDDWLFAYLGQFYGAAELVKGFAGDRPAVGYLFAINHTFLGSNLLLWHIYMFLMRLLGGYLLFFLLKKVWPDKLSIITSITILFLIFPGFLQQTAPLGYQNYITALTIWIASLFFTVLAITNRNKIAFAIFTLIALIFQALSFLLLEFFIGMEALRLSLILYITIPNFSVKDFTGLKRKIVYWSPYIIGLLLFSLWRIFIFHSAREATDINWITKNYYSDVVWLAKIPLKIMHGWVSAVVFAYVIPFIVGVTRLPIEKSAVFFLTGLMSGTLFYYYHKTISKIPSENSINNSIKIKKFGKALSLIGSIAIIGALIPIILSGRFVSVANDATSFDRYTISSIIGVALVIVGLLLYKLPSSMRRLFLVLLITISITTHLMNSYWHAIYWNKQKSIWWQLYWRSPKIQKSALLIFDFPKIINKNDQSKTLILVRTLRPEDYLIWAPGNLFFNYLDSPMNHFSGQYLPIEGTVQRIRNKIVEPIKQESSTIKYTNDFNNIVIISLPTDNSCLWVLDEKTEELPDNASELAESNIAYSNVDKLLLENTVTIPPAKIFGPEPSHTWCYYFQKASLARHLKDWVSLDQLAKEVLAKNLSPKDTNEWLPFIEGQIVSNKYSEANKLIKIASNKQSKHFTLNLCRMINRLKVAELKRYCI